MGQPSPRNPLPPPFQEHGEHGEHVQEQPSWGAWRAYRGDESGTWLIQRPIAGSKRCVVQSRAEQSRRSGSDVKLSQGLARLGWPWLAGFRVRHSPGHRHTLARPFADGRARPSRPNLATSSLPPRLHLNSHFNAPLSRAGFPSTSPIDRFSTSLSK